jgi:predicted kinase
VKYLIRNAATERLGWILDGLDGQEDWGADAADVIAPEFAAVAPPGRIVELTRQHSAAFAPVAVVGLDITGNTAKARIRSHDGNIHVVSCTVEPEPPHRITSTWTAGFIPAGLTPRLPMDFTEYPMPRHNDGSRLIIFSGLPGTGKSTLADAVGRRLDVPVFAVDWLLGSLTSFGGYHLDGQWDIGSEILTTLALRQLILGQSAILDHPVEERPTRARWRTLAQRTGSDFKVVVCTCSDLQVHRTRLENRKRGIPGWHETGDWADVQRRLADFPPWPDNVLTVDTAQPHDRNLAAVLDWLSSSASTALPGSRTASRPDAGSGNPR